MLLHGGPGGGADAAREALPGFVCRGGVLAEDTLLAGATWSRALTSLKEAVELLRVSFLQQAISTVGEVYLTVKQLRSFMRPATPMPLKRSDIDRSRMLRRDST